MSADEKQIRVLADNILRDIKDVSDALRNVSITLEHLQLAGEELQAMSDNARESETSTEQ